MRQKLSKCPRVKECENLRNISYQLIKEYVVNQPEYQ